MTGQYSIGEVALGGSGQALSPPLASTPGFAWQKTVLSQYANSPVILQLLANIAAYVDPTTLFDQFYDDIWNIETAQGYGLDVLGRIVGVSRVLRVPQGAFFGFSQSATAKGFNQAPFYNGQSLTSNYALSDRAYRTLILAKAAANITDGSIPSINAILMTLFYAYGNSYVEDHGDMTMSYHFGRSLSAVDYAIVSQSGVLPKPAGVSVTIVQGS